MTHAEATQMPPAQSPRKSRNGLIDLYRFLLSLVVVKSHSLFVLRGPYFGPGRACVEFFFVLSGYLFWSFLNKSKDRSIKESLVALHRTRFLPLAIPLCIGVLSNLVESIVVGSFGLWGYLWYVEVMFIEMIVLILLRKWIRDDRIFMLTIMGIMLIALVLKFFGPFYSWGFFRGASSIPIGVFLASLPKLRKKRFILPPLVLAIAACFLMVCFHLSDVDWLGYRIPELILDTVLYPALIYFSFCLKFESRICSYLGALSFGLYAFQCTADLFRTLGLTNIWLLFGFILLATLLEDGGKRFYRHIRAKRA